MDRDRSIKRAWDVFGAPPPPSGRQTTPPSRHQAAAPSRLKVPKDSEKHASSDSAISGSSDEEEREICRIFHYLNEEEASGGRGRRCGEAGARQDTVGTGMFVALQVTLDIN